MNPSTFLAAKKVNCVFGKDQYTKTEERTTNFEDGQMMRSISENELLIEIDIREDYDNEEMRKKLYEIQIKNFEKFEELGFEAFLFNHKGKSPHIRLYNFEGLNKENQESYFINFVEKYCIACPEGTAYDKSFYGSFHWSPIEFQVHYKYGTKYELEKSCNEGNKNIFEPELATEVKEIKKRKISLGYWEILKNPKADEKQRCSLVTQIHIAHPNWEKQEVIDYICKHQTWEDFSPEKTIEKINLTWKFSEKIDSQKPEEKQKIPEIDEKLNLVLQFDKKLAKIIENEIKYATENAKEKALLCKLIPYGFDFEQIDYILTQKIKTQIWVTATKKHKLELFEQSNEFMKNIPKTSLNEYIGVEIKEIRIYPNQEDSVIKIIVKDGEITLNKDTLLNPNHFKTMYYVISKGIMLPPIKIETWAKIITFWTKKFGKICESEISTEENLIKEKLIEEIESFIIVDELKQSIFFGRAFCEDETILIPSSSIETIVRKYKFNIKMTKLAIALEEYLIKKSEPKRVGGKLVRFWFFRKSKINLEHQLEQKNGDDND